MESGTCALLVYVDDLLVMAEHEGDVTAKFDLIRANAESRVFFLKVSAEVIMSFYVASMALHDIRTCSTSCRKPVYLTGAIFLLYFSWQAQHFGQKCDVVPSPVECHFAWQAQLSVTPYTAHPVHSTFNSKLHNLRTHTHTPHCTF